MNKYEDVKINVFGSRKEFKSYDAQDENQIAYSIRDKVLPELGVEYHSVRVKVKRKPDHAPEYLIAYMLRKDTYTADVVKIEIDANYQVQNTIRDYDDSGEEDDDEGEQYGQEPTYAHDFVVATPEDSIPTAVAAVNHIYNLTKSAGLKPVKLVGAAANIANYKAYLKSGVKGFVNIGHGYTGGIVLSDGTLKASWFNGLTGKPLRPAVVYFNSCQVFNNPLQPAIMQAGARSYIGGIVNLFIGPSEKVCMCFWERSLKTLIGMLHILKKCEQEKYPTQGAHGFSGEKGIFWDGKWFNNRKIIRTHAKHGSQMAWAILDGSSWIRLQPNSADGVSNTFMQLCDGLANNRKVDVYICKSQIQQVTLR
ncbi:MAG: hypothetical protein PVI97_20945 [Candidatus Thiodiazotropha sp.]|jgi:hypothetical protein